MANSDHLKIALKGYEAWNHWRAKYPNEKVDFSAADFSSPEYQALNFAGYNFGRRVNFCGARFGNGISFVLAAFGEKADFSNCIFGGPATFAAASFSGLSNFDHSQFQSTADFAATSFIGDAIFCNAVFTGSARFVRATFIKFANWQKCRFGAEALFDGAQFYIGASFVNATFVSNFGMNEASLLDRKVFVGEGKMTDVMPSDNWPTEFVIEKSSTNQLSDQLRQELHDKWSSLISTASIPTRDMNFSRSRFQGNARFEDRTFHGDINFSHARFLQPPSFSGTKELGQLNLVGAEFRFRGSIGPIVLPSWIFGKKSLLFPTPGWTTQPNVASRIRRLRKIANDIHAIDAERDLFILERKAERGIYLASGEQDAILLATGHIFLLFLYSLFSDCGRSMLRPTISLFFSFPLFRALYMLSVDSSNVSERTEYAADTFTLAHMLPFVGSTRTSLQSAVQEMFSTGIVPFWVNVTAAIQSFLSATLIFLFLLALRNHFRVK
jgi:hypothetical protein